MLIGFVDLIDKLRPTVESLSLNSAVDLLQQVHVKNWYYD